MSFLDKAILETFPFTAVPPSGQVLPAAASGTRFLAAHDGLWREITLPWIRLVHKVGTTSMKLPYGAIEQSVEFPCGPVPLGLIDDFCDQARASAPAEIAAAVTWSELSNEWTLRYRHARSSSAAHIEYDEVRLAEGEHLVLDVHSHGHHPAFFSAQDDHDDMGAMKVSLVVGNCTEPRRTARMRLCMAGFVQPARLDVSGQLEVIR